MVRSGDAGTAIFVVSCIMLASTRFSPSCKKAVPMNENKPRPRRSYPEIYEKLIPIILIVIVAAIVVISIAALAVAFRLFP